MLARGCGNVLVGVQGIVNMRWTGIPRAWAQCICANEGGLAMIASATKGRLVSGEGSIHDRQQPSSISSTIFRFRDMSPARIDARLGIMDGLLTMYLTAPKLVKWNYIQQLYVLLTDISCSGSPPIGKNSRPAFFTKSPNTS